MAGGGVLLGSGTPAPRDGPRSCARLTAGCFPILEPSRFPALLLPPTSNCVSFTKQQLWAPGKRREITPRKEAHGLELSPVPAATSTKKKKKKSLNVFGLDFGGRRIHVSDFAFAKKKKMTETRCPKSPAAPRTPRRCLCGSATGGTTLPRCSAVNCRRSDEHFRDASASGAEALGSGKFAARLRGSRSRALSWGKGGNGWDRLQRAEVFA